MLFEKGSIGVSDLMEMAEPVRRAKCMAGLLWILPLPALAVDASVPVAAPVVMPEAAAPLSGYQRYVENRLSVYIDSHYYDWEGDNFTSGRQYVTPLTVTYRMGEVEAGLRTGLVSSRNTTPGREGEVTTVGDTNLSVALMQKLRKGWSIRYNLDWNLPTGKESLGGTQKNAVMDGNLVQQTRFGEGTNVTPALSVIKVFSRQAQGGFGFGHTWKGRYDPNSDVLGDELDPGDENHLTLQGQYGRPDWLVVGGLVYTTSGDTDFGGSPYYRKGNRTDVNVTGMKALPNAQQLTLGLRYSTQEPDTYVDRKSGNYQKESSNINGHSTYVFGEYAKGFGRHSLKGNVSLLRIAANSYDQLSDLYNAGRVKRELGVGYGFQLDRKRGLHVDVKRMSMDDKATPATVVDTGYSGWNVSVGMGWGF